MKHGMITALVLAVLALTACGTTRQTAQEKRAEQERIAQSVRKVLDERSFQIDIDYMIPQRGGAQSVSAYSITVKGDTIDSHLPYRGEAWSIPYGGGSGLSFQGKIEKYTDNGFQKDRRNITINVRNQEDAYVYTMDIFDNGSADIHVHCQNRDDISYHGTLSLKAPED